MKNPTETEWQTVSPVEHESTIEWLYPRELFPLLRVRPQLVPGRGRVRRVWPDKRLLVAMARLDDAAEGVGCGVRETHFWRRAFFLVHSDIEILIPQLQAALDGNSHGAAPDGWPTMPPRFPGQPNSFQDEWGWGLPWTTEWTDAAELQPRVQEQRQCRMRGARYELMAPALHARLLAVLLDWQADQNKKRAKVRDRQRLSRADRARQKSVTTAENSP